MINDNIILCNLIKNYHGRLEVLIDDLNTDEYIGFDQHEKIVYALYKTLKKYFKKGEESHGRALEPSIRKSRRNYCKQRI